MFEKVVIKKRVDTITADMIKNRKLKVCVLPDSVKSIGPKTFYNCSNLKKIIFVDEDGNVVNNKIEEIGYAAFANTSIEKFVYTHYLKIIEESAFDNTPLTALEYEDDNLESGLKVIEKAFLNTKITDMVISPTVRKLVMCPEWKSLLCKDNNGNIVPFNKDLVLVGDYSNLEEISLLGENIECINSIIKEGIKLKKIHMSINDFHKCRLYLSNIRCEVVLYGETEKLDSYLHSCYYNQITVTFDSNVKIKKITEGFISNICNEKLVLPEGIEEVEPIYNNNLKYLEFPSTLKQIADYARIFVKTIAIHKNLSINLYKKICSVIPKRSKLIIKGDYFTDEERLFFESITPSGIILEFVESKPLNFEKSTNQRTIDELSQEIISLINLMPDDLKLIVQKKYNKIIDDYNENRMKEEQSILEGSNLFVNNSYFGLRGELLNLHAEIILYQQDIIKLNKMEDYKKQVLELKKSAYDPISLDNQNDSIDNIERLIKSIYTKISTYGYPVLYLIISQIEKFILETETIYRNRINHILDSNSPFSSSNPVQELDGTLTRILVTLDNPIVQEVMKLRGSFYPKYGDIEKIESLADNIKSIYNAALTNSKISVEWSFSIVNPYSDLLDQILIRAINQENIEQDFADMKKRLKRDLILFLDKAIIISDNTCYASKKKREIEEFCQSGRNYKDMKIKEVNDAYQFFCDNDLNKEDIKHTVSSLLMIEIMKINENIKIFSDPYNIQEIIKIKVGETIDKLNLMCDIKNTDNILAQFKSEIINASTMEIVDQKVDEAMKLLVPICKCENVDDVMQQFYKSLTDIWAKVWELTSFKNEKVILKKL